MTKFHQVILWSDHLLSIMGFIYTGAKASLSLKRLPATKVTIRVLLKKDIDEFTFLIIYQDR